MRYYVNIGSNIGEKEDNISLAIDYIQQEFGKIEKSGLVESEPWGFDSTNSFINIGVKFENSLNPLEVLKKLQEIEKRISDASHRDAAGRYVDRIIDIDIMAAESYIINHPDLIIPHTHLAERKFFLIPMKELEPSWLHPVLKKTPQEMLESLYMVYANK